MESENWWGLGVILALIALVLGVYGCNVTTASGIGGQGSSVGIVTTVEYFDHAVLFDDYYKLWFRASDATSQTDCYALAPDQVETAKAYAKSREVVTINFETHRFWSWQGKCSPDTVMGFSK